MKHIIQDENGEFKSYEAHELPDGCIVSYRHNLLHESYSDEYGRTQKFPEIGHRDIVSGGSHRPQPQEILKIHDIVDDKGNSTHVKRWMAMSYDANWSGIYYDKPTRWEGGRVWQGVASGSTCKYGSGNNCGQTWDDEPWIVWERIK